MGAFKFSTALLLVIVECLMRVQYCECRMWQTNINYKNPENWDLGRVPCAGDRIVLQNSVGVAVQLPEGGASLRELVLPSYSELVLPKDGLVQFTGRKKSPTCDGQDITLKPVQTSRWINARNWDGWNAATPDVERIPCASDAVRFPTGAVYKIIMPDYLKVASLEINGMMIDSVDNYNAGGGPRLFQTADGLDANVDITGYPCGPTEWCECDNSYLHSQICASHCTSNPLCLQPVLPHGFCCPVCGAYFLLENTPHNKSQLTDHVNSFLMDKGVVWHASKVGKDVQVVLVEATGYTGAVTDVAGKLKVDLTRSGFGWVAKEFHASGHVLYPMSFGQIMIHFFSLMVAAALALAAILAFYSRDWSWARFSSLEGRPFVFARFENQTDEVVVASEERQRQQPETHHPQTFDNPLYEVTKQGQGNGDDTSSYTELDNHPSTT